MAKKKSGYSGAGFLFDQKLAQNVESVPLPADMISPDIPKKQVRTRDGEVLTKGDEVMFLSGMSLKYQNVVFIIEKMTEFPLQCESGIMCVVYQKDNPDEKIKGMLGIGIDANWFTKVKHDDI